MKFRFYFDYSDYRSYLMMHSLRSIEDLPVTVEWIAIDAYSLRAMSGCQLDTTCRSRQSYLQKEAIRFCQREHLEFVWQSERYHSGAALRAGIRLMKTKHPMFCEYSRKVLDLMWGKGLPIDTETLKSIFAMLDISRDDLMKTSSQRDDFQIQDASLKEAIDDGIFDVPTLVIGSQIVCHFDSADEIRRLSLMECLRELPSETLVQALSELLTRLPPIESRPLIQTLLHVKEPHTALPQVLPEPCTIPHTIPVPEIIRHCPKTPFSGLTAVRLPSTARDKKLKNALQTSTSGMLTLSTSAYEVRTSDVFTAQPDILFCAFSSDGSLMAAQSDETGRVTLTIIANDMAIFATANGTKVAILPPASSRDLNQMRLAAHLGAHVIIMSGSAAPLPAAEAAGLISDAWIVDITQDDIALVDAHAHRKSLAQNAQLLLNERTTWPDQNVWQAPTPRTLLLFEKQITFGESADHTDIELSVRGMNLCVTTKQQSTELGHKRVFEKLRLNGETLLLLPVCGESIFITEYLSHQFVESINQAPADSLPVLISYWSELAFEALECMRPHLAALCALSRIPIVLVVGSQVAEIWQSSPQGMPWRIEKDEDAYAIDLAELIPISRCFEHILSMTGLRENDFVARLEQIDQAMKQA